MMLWLALLLFFAALFVLRGANKRRQMAGLPGGRVIYTDTSKWGAVEEPLFDPAVRLTGKPDYLVKRGKQIIPVEVKSSRAPDAPYDSHIYQVAAYCMLVERQYGQRPPYGIIHYSGGGRGGGRNAEQSFAVDYTVELEEALLDLLAEMRRADHRKEVHRSHEQSGRCGGCGFAYTCEQSL